ncbi:MAG: hypothetical protein HQM15_00075 [Deltaproteobacteria bacterium]|nr:hypothetical protein [Deltaproteobacteria bacterium]
MSSEGGVKPTTVSSFNSSPDSLVSRNPRYSRNLGRLEPVAAPRDASAYVSQASANRYAQAPQAPSRNFWTRGWENFSIFDLIPFVGCTPERITLPSNQDGGIGDGSIPSDANPSLCSSSSPSNIPHGIIHSYDNSIEIEVPNTLSLPPGVYSYDPNYEIYREDWLGNRLLRRGLLANQVGHSLLVENNRVLISDEGTAEMPLQAGLYYRYSLRPQLRSANNTYCASPEALVVGVQRSGTYDPNNSGTYAQRINGSYSQVCFTGPRLSPILADVSNSRFYTFQFENVLLGGLLQTIGVQISRNIPDITEERAHSIANYVANQVQRCDTHLIRERGFQALPFSRGLYRVFAETDAELSSTHPGGFYEPDYIGLSAINILRYFYTNSSHAFSETTCSNPIILHEMTHHYTGFGPLFNNFPGIEVDSDGLERYFVEGIAKDIEQDAGRALRSYRPVLEFSVNPDQVRENSTEALDCFARLRDPCHMLDPADRQSCCAAQYEGLRLFLEPSAPTEFQNLSFSLYQMLPNEFELRIRRDGETGQELVVISDLSEGNQFSCSHRFTAPSGGRLNWDRHFGIGDACLVPPSSGSQRRLLIFDEDNIHTSGVGLECGQNSFNTAGRATLHLSDGGVFQNTYWHSSPEPYLPSGSRPYEAGACFFSELESLNPSQFRELLPVLQGNAGFSQCQSFDAIAWFAERMGVAPVVIDEMVRRFGLPNDMDSLRHGRAVTYSEVY